MKSYLIEPQITIKCENENFFKTRRLLRYLWIIN